MGQNIYIELGFDDDDATVMALEAGVAVEIARFVEARFPRNQVAAAKHLKISQGEVSQILKGNIQRFSLSRLVRIARHADLRLYLDTGDSAYNASVSVRPSTEMIGMVTGTIGPMAIAGEAEVFNAVSLPNSPSGTAKSSRDTGQVH